MVISTTGTERTVEQVARVSGRVAGSATGGIAESEALSFLEGDFVGEKTVLKAFNAELGPLGVVASRSGCCVAVVKTSEPAKNIISRGISRNIQIHSRTDLQARLNARQGAHVEPTPLGADAWTQQIRPPLTHIPHGFADLIAPAGIIVFKSKLASNPVESRADLVFFVGEDSPVWLSPVPALGRLESDPIAIVVVTVGTDGR